MQGTFHECLREAKEQSGRNDSKECSKDIKWPLASINKSATQKKDSVAVEILVVSSSARFVVVQNRSGLVVCR